MNALAGDPVSAFGGIIVFNKKVNGVTAKNLLKNFYEVVAAPDFDVEALKILKEKVNLRVLKVKKFKLQLEKRSIFAGTLIQSVNNKKSSIKKVYGLNIKFIHGFRRFNYDLYYI